MTIRKACEIGVLQSRAMGTKHSHSISMEQHLKDTIAAVKRHRKKGMVRSLVPNTATDIALRLLNAPTP